MSIWDGITLGIITAGLVYAVYWLAGRDNDTW